MELRNFQSIESISNYCFYCGIIPLFLGIIVICIDIIYGEFDHILVGIFISITGYAQVKISTKLDAILKEERKKLELAENLRFMNQNVN